MSDIRPPLEVQAAFWTYSSDPMRLPSSASYFDVIGSALQNVFKRGILHGQQDGQKDRIHADSWRQMLAYKRLHK